MIRLWRSLIGITWGVIVGAIAMHFAGMLFGYHSALIYCVVYGLPILFGFIGGVLEDWWYDFWPIIVYPLLSLILVAIVLFVILCIVLVRENPLHLIWILALIGVFVPPTTKGIIILFEK